uniref:Reverse transcriptase/retrotransposon-derived protein RNase H-like domain-containing protein n=1 Tax=Otus sunia TaxID=257818 RepID=A0A8C8AT93_9STRI
MLLRHPWHCLGWDEVEPLRWGPEREKAFHAMTGALASSPALGLPDYSKFFELFVHENKGVATGVFTQKLHPHCRPVAYYSVRLDPVPAGSNSCVRARAATATSTEKSRPLVPGDPTTVDHTLSYFVLILMLKF